MNWSQNFKLRIPAHLALAASLTLLIAGRLSAQDVEKLYQKGMDDVHNARMEDACEELKQVESLQPGYQQAGVYMKVACRETTKLYDHEQENYNQGVQLFNQGKYEDAKQAFQNALKLKIKNPKYHAQAQQYLDQINARQGDARLYEDAVRLFKQGNFSAARTNLNKLAQGNGPRAGDAKNLLAQIDEAERKRQQEQEGKKNALPQTPQQPSTMSELSLRAGLQAYFKGKYVEAETSLSDYLTNKGSKQQLAYFFRGASHSAQYFLSGEKDSQEKNLALQDFRALKGLAATFQPPEGYVSPKILALYREAAGAPGQ
jgi:outer membrane protein assembly factor BamD (BamD/ComL family)